MQKSNIDNTNNTQIPAFFSAYTESDLARLIEAIVERVLAQHLSNMSNTPDTNQLLNRAEAAKEFNVSVGTIDNYRRDGLIIPCRLGGTVRFKRGDLQAAFSGNILNPYKKAGKGKRG